MGSAGKKELRKLILSRRNSLPEGERKRLSRMIKDRFIGMVEEEGFDVVMVYFSIGSEVETYELARELLGMGKRVCGPAILKREKELLPLLVRKIPDQLVRGPYGIPEPSKELCEPIDPREIDAVVVPGVAFDLRGYRIGYGGGYYDRFLRKCENALRVGLAFELQILDRIENEDWDEPVHAIVTERRVIRIGRA